MLKEKALFGSGCFYGEQENPEFKKNDVVKELVYTE